ncbi:MAG TPA: MmgE/PrpD family protein [Streptosporangiaceae bacterium]
MQVPARDTAEGLAAWAETYVPTADDLEMAHRALLDTVAVTVAARRHPVTALTQGMSEPLRWGTIGHVLDFDDLHLQSTTHVSVVCVPAVLAAGGDERAYLAAAGVMTRLGMALGWPHYAAGWHITCTTGAIAAAVGAAVSDGLSRKRIAAAIALAVPASGGVQRAFGADAKSLQVGFAVDAGLRAARLAGRGATAAPAALDDWIKLVSGRPDAPIAYEGPAVPGGLAIKIYPACYAVQRPIACLAKLRAAELRPAGLDTSDVQRIVLRTPEATVVPLIHHRPVTGLEGKFSLEYAAAAALLDEHTGFASFTDEAVCRPQAQSLMQRVDTELTPGSDGLLDGELEAEVITQTGRRIQAALKHPPGSPARPPTPAQFAAKLEDCLRDSGADWRSLTWRNAADIVRAQLNNTVLDTTVLDTTAEARRARAT